MKETLTQRRKLRYREKGAAPKGASSNVRPLTVICALSGNALMLMALGFSAALLYKTVNIVDAAPGDVGSGVGAGQPVYKPVLPSKQQQRLAAAATTATAATATQQEPSPSSSSSTALAKDAALINSIQRPTVLLEDGKRFGAGSSEDFEAMFPQRFKPSPAYEKAFAAQAARQRAASTGSGSFKYVLCSPSAQLGNRLRFVVACFALALLTERVLVVSMKTGYHAGLKDIFDLEQLPLDAGSFHGVPNGGKSISFPHSNNQLTCTDIREWAETTVTLSGAYYFVPHLFYNPHLKPLIDAYFPEGMVAARIQRTALRPHPEVMKIVKAEYDRLEMGDASWLVAMQIRGNKPPAPQFWISQPEFKSYNDCAEALVPEGYKENIKEFWACDSGLAIRETMSSVLGSNGKGLHRWEPDQFVKSGSIMGVRNALADILLQAKCDDLLICAWSSYGQVAAAYHMAPSYMVTDFDKPDGYDYANSGTVVPLCYKTETTEYSVREWGSWSRRIQCYKPSFTNEYPGKQWATPGH